MSKLMVIDKDVADEIQEYEIRIYMCLQSEEPTGPILGEVLTKLNDTYEISDMEDTSDVTRSKRHYIWNSVIRLFKGMVSDCEERLENKKKVVDQLKHLKTLKTLKNKNN